jgi:hypothetical protein
VKDDLTALAQKLLSRLRDLLALGNAVSDTKVLSARILTNQLLAAGVLDDLQRAEFKVFSQFGEDGIIQYLVHVTRISPAERRFVEFGVESYQESNTRLLVLKDNWTGLVIDGDRRNIRQIKNDRIYWRHQLQASCAFIDAENINQLINAGGVVGDIGLLSIDIDGNDYWVWKSISGINPVLVVIEYNSVFGPDHAVSVPYDRAFRRGDAHFSHLYWGCSIKALEALGRSKGYALVGSNSAGNNAFFVRRDRLSALRALTAAEAYVESKFRESRDRRGKLTFLSGRERLSAIRELPVVDLEKNEARQIASLYRC